MVFALVGDSTMTSEPFPFVDATVSSASVSSPSAESAITSTTGEARFFPPRFLGAGAGAGTGFSSAAAFFFTGFFLAATDQPFIINGPGDGRGGIFTSLHRSAQGRPGPAPLAPPPSCPSQPSRPLGDTRPRDPSRAPSSAPPGPPPLTTGGFPRGPRGRRPSAGSSSDTPQTPEASPRQWRPVCRPAAPRGDDRR